MVHQSILLLLLDLALLLLNLFLLLNLEHVVLSLDSSLLSQRVLLFGELLLSGNLKVSLDPHPLLVLESFSLPGLSLTLLEGSLGSECVNFGLSISCLLLELSESLDLSLLLVLDPLGLQLGFILLLVSSLLVSDDLILLIFLLLGSLLLLDQGLSIGLSSLLHEDIDSLPLGLGLLLVLLLHLLDIVEQLESLFVSNLLLLHPLDSSVLDLIDDDLSALLSGFMLPLFSLLFLLEDLEPLDLHHEVELLLLLDPLVLETLVLLQLLVSDGDDLGVEHHLVHRLHIVQVVV